MKTYGELSILLRGISPEKFDDLAETKAQVCLGWAAKSVLTPARLKMI
jgi:hypothetical protein